MYHNISIITYVSYILFCLVHFGAGHNMYHTFVILYSFIVRGRHDLAVQVAKCEFEKTTAVMQLQPSAVEANAPVEITRHARGSTSNTVNTARHARGCKIQWPLARCEKTRMRRSVLHGPRPAGCSPANGGLICVATGAPD